MSTIKSSNEHLTINADGSSKDIKFQANGVEKASISSSGAFTSTTIDATKLTGNLPAISGASLTGLPNGSQLDYSGTKTIEAVSDGALVGGTAGAKNITVESTSGSGTISLIQLKNAGESFNLEVGRTAGAFTIRDNTNGERFKLTSDGRGLSQFTAKAWFNLDQTGTQNLRDSHNISSVSDNGTGRTTYSFANNLGSINYSVTLSTNGSANNAYGGSWDNDRQSCMFNLAVGSFSTANAPSGSYLDYDLLCGMVFGD